MTAKEAREKSDQYNLNEEDFKMALSYIIAAAKGGFYNTTIPFSMATIAVESKLKSLGYELRINDNGDTVVYW